ncbi:MAG: hypothetical protein AAF702_34890 [Chloroflexota bacterium]
MASPHAFEVPCVLERANSLDTLLDVFHVGRGDLAYLWLDHWVNLPETPSQTSNNQDDARTHGIALSETGNVIIFHQADPAVLIYNSTGELLDRWGDRFPGAHGLTLVKEGKEEFLWLADSVTGEVVKTTLAGQEIQSIVPPDCVIYDVCAYKPTSVAVDEERFGGSGDIWVADGYGASYLHRYDKKGNYLQSINGTEGPAGKFRCPHNIWIDNRKLEPELYIADQENRRVQVYDLEGNFLRTFGEGILTSPSAFASYKDYLIIPELRGRVTILDSQDNFVCYLGENEAVCEIDGWPNLPSDLLMVGRFNSPHDVATDPDGNIYLVEWVIGGRVTKLVKKLIH